LINTVRLLLVLVHFSSYLLTHSYAAKLLQKGITLTRT
jgi:site-specific recombinase XerD